MVKSTEGWATIVLSCLEEVRTPVIDGVLAIVGQHFGRYEESGLLTIAT